MHHSCGCGASFRRKISGSSHLGGKFLEVHIFHWRGGYLTKEVLNELLDLIRKAGMEKEKNAMVSINWPQAVLRVQYADIQVQESVMLEEANEGEKD